MPLQKLKPTSPGRRFTVKVNTVGLHKGRPHEPLLDDKSRSGGRNNKGRITVRHRGGGHKRRYRVVDFKRNKDGVPGKVERIEAGTLPTADSLAENLAKADATSESIRTLIDAFIKKHRFEELAAS